MILDLLEQHLPELFLRPDVTPADFLDRCEELAKDKGYSIDRRREVVGPGYDQLNLHLVKTADDSLMVRMVCRPQLQDRLSVDVVAHGTHRTREYDEYIAAARFAYGVLLDDYAVKFGKKLRLRIPKRKPRLDHATVDCTRIEYAQNIFHFAIRDMAVGKGDARERIHAAFGSIHVVQPEHLPVPLDTHLRWVYEQMTWRSPRHPKEGTLDATVWQMRRSTASRLAERIVAIGDALDRLHEWCRRNGRDGDRFSTVGIADE